MRARICCSVPYMDPWIDWWKSLYIYVVQACIESVNTCYNLYILDTSHVLARSCQLQVHYLSSTQIRLACSCISDHDEQSIYIIQDCTCNCARHVQVLSYPAAHSYCIYPV